MMRYILVSFLVWLFVWQEAYSAEEKNEVASQVNIPVTLLIKEDILISGYRILLSDIVECKGFKNVCSEIYGVEIADISVSGPVKSLTTKALLKLAQEEWPTAVISIVGPQYIPIKMSLNTITRTGVNKALENELNKFTEKQQNLRLALVSTQMSTESKTLSQNYKLKFPDLDILNQNNAAIIASKLSGAPNLKVEVYPDELGGETKTEEFRVIAKLNIEALLPVAKKELKRNSVIDPFDFEYRWVSLSNTRNKFETNVARIQGTSLKYDLKNGEAIPASGYKSVDSIKRGDVVQLHHDKNGISILSKVKVLANGNVGDVIEAEMFENKKRIQVEVIDSQNVKYRF